MDDNDSYINVSEKIHPQAECENPDVLNLERPLSGVGKWVDGAHSPRNGGILEENANPAVDNGHEQDDSINLSHNTITRSLSKDNYDDIPTRQLHSQEGHVQGSEETILISSDEHGNDQVSDHEAPRNDLRGDNNYGGSAEEVNEALNPMLDDKDKVAVDDSSMPRDTALKSDEVGIEPSLGDKFQSLCPGLPEIISQEQRDEEDSDTEMHPSSDPCKVSRPKSPKSPFFNPFDPPDTPRRDSRRCSSDEIPLDDPNLVDPVAKSPAEREWERQKEELEEKNEALDKVMKMVGLEHVKTSFLEIKSLIDASQSRKGYLSRRDLNLVLLGNPGTGKRTLTKLYYDFLKERGVWGGEDTEIEELSGHAFIDSSEIQDLDSFIKRGVLSIVDVDFVNSDVRALMLSVLARLSLRIVVVISGYANGESAVIGSLPEGKWLFPRRLQLKDYNDDELSRVFLRISYQDSMRIEGGPSGPYPKILARRLGRGREELGFGNIHELKSSYVKILERQATRLRQEMARIKDSGVGPVPDENLLTGQDIIGPEPEDIREKSDAWKVLEKMVGLEDVKSAVVQIFGQAKANYHKEVQGKKLNKTSLNRVFMGPPGTGKTTAAKLYGQVLVDAGLLSAREVVYTTPADFIGQVIGESEAKTHGIINSTKGKVLIIDDAHMFYHGSRGGTSNESDEYRLASIDVLVSKIHNNPGEDRCVILLGYTEMLEEMFQKCNPGLRRRFPLEEAFRFGDYDSKHLREILELKMKEEEITATDAAMKVAAEVLGRARDRPNFGNGGDVVNLLNQAKTRCRDRIAKKRKEMVTERNVQGSDHETEMVSGGMHFLTNGETDSLDLNDISTTTLEPGDFDPDYDRGATASEKCRDLFRGLIGFEEIIQKFERYQCVAENMRLSSNDPKEVIPFTYVFKGPPGTGKTKTAGILGQIFYDMGFLSSTHVEVCSATDLIGRYVGQTGPKVVELFEKALGKILFIDEAYRLGYGSGSRVVSSFAEEAVGEMVDCLTRPRYHRKMIVVLSGYTREMDLLMKVNAGLRGRFAMDIEFSSLSPRRCLQLFCDEIKKRDITLLEEPGTTPDEKEDIQRDRETVIRLFSKLKLTKGWSNARDVQTLASIVVTHVYGSREGFQKGKNSTLFVTKSDLIRFQKEMLRQRIKGGIASPKK